MKEDRMVPHETPPIHRVRFSDGGTFESNATSAAHYLLDTCFVRFLFLCVLLYGVLAQRNDLIALDLYERIIVWMIIFVSSGLWLLFSLSTYVKLVDRGYFSYIFTPVIFLPLVPVNVLLSLQLSFLFGAPGDISLAEMAQPIVQNLIVIICFDILHGRYVAPTHPTFVRADADGPLPAPSPQFSNGRRATDVAQSNIDQTNSASDSTNASSIQMPEPQSPIAPVEPVKLVKIASQAFPLSKLKYIQSQDHYLKVHLDDESKMLRGVLGQTVKKLPAEWGDQINRSVWVAFGAIEKVEENSKGYLEITLHDATKFRVSSARRLIFLSGFEKHQANLE